MTDHPRHRHDVWGDDPEERDASAVYEEFRTDERVQREWHDRVPLAPFKVVWRFLSRNGKRIAVTVAGFAVLLAGVALLVLPGPGWLLIFIGLGILSTEYVWAQKMLNTAKAKAEQAKEAVVNRKNGRAAKREARRNGGAVGAPLEGTPNEPSRLDAEPS
jgi:uncharacterized protein (TIGR02611 family)